MPSDDPPPTPDSPSGTPSEPLGYRSPADDRPGREKVSLATLLKLTLAIVGSLVVVLLFLPWTGRPREVAQRVKCASGLRHIGQALHLYADANNGHYPVALSIAFADSGLPIEWAFCPNHRSQVPTTLPSLLLDAKSDYLYVGAGLTISAPSDIIVAYERPGSHGTDGVNVLYSDGRVEFLSLPDLQKALETSHAQRQALEHRPRGTPP